MHESVVPVPVDLIKFCWAMRAAYLITAVFVAFGGDVVYAQPSYSCVNAEGKTVEGDQPPPEWCESSAESRAKMTPRR